MLLDSGSTPVTRKAAAEQIGEVQKLHPHELQNLLKKVCTFLSSKSWETRIAAGQAVEAIARNVKKWQPVYQPKQGEENGSSHASLETSADLLSFETFNINKVLAHGTPLLSSTGDEFALENDPDYQKMSFQERASFHRQQLQEQLGLVSQGKVFSTGLETFIDDSDLEVSPDVAGHLSSSGQQLLQQHIQKQEVVGVSGLGLSAREKNKAKRKAKLFARRTSRDTDQEKGEGEPPTKKPKTTSVVVEQAGQSDKVVIDHIPDTDSVFEETDDWPFFGFCEEMFNNLFSPIWEVRHGAATALREVIRLHGDTAGITCHTSPGEYATENQRWLVDAVIRLLCVFALDKFADFVSDQVVAPVRATCAQVLGVVVKLMSQGNVGHVVELLLVLAREGQWEVRHASLMGTQHLLAARTDLFGSYLPHLWPSIIQGLKDVDDDVRSVAATALVPVADQLHIIMASEVTQLVHILWDSLLNLDDLSSSTNSIVDLLCTLLSSTSPTSSQVTVGSGWSELVPRLWPFLSHAIGSVRSSCLRAVLTLLQREEGGRGMVEPGEQVLWLRPLLQALLCHAFQRLVLEGEEGNRDLLHEVWLNALNHSSISDLAVSCAPVMVQWLCLLVAPGGYPVDPSLLLSGATSGQASSSVFLGGSLGVESLVSKEQSAFRARVCGSKALGLLATRLQISLDLPESQQAIGQLVSGLQQLLMRNTAVHRAVAGLIVSHWGHCPPDLLPTFSTLLEDQGFYEELTPYVLSLQKDCHLLIAAFEKRSVNIAPGVTPSGYTVQFASTLATSLYQDTIGTLALSEGEMQEFDALRTNVLTSIGLVQEEHLQLQTRVHSCVAGALVTLNSLPSKLNPVIRPLMDSIKSGSDPLVQLLCAGWLSKLLDCCRDRSPSPNAKIIKNICTFVSCDPLQTPAIENKGDPLVTKVTLKPRKGGGASPDHSEKLEHWHWRDGVITLVRNHPQTSARSHHRGVRSAIVREATALSAGVVMDDRMKGLNSQRRGGEATLTSLAKHFGVQLFTSLPQLWSYISQPLQSLPVPSPNQTELSEDLVAAAQDVVSGLQVLEAMAPAVSPALRPQLLALLPSLLRGLLCPFTAIRHMCARCISAMAKVDLHHTLQFVVTHVLPYLGDTEHIHHRQGTIEAIATLLGSVGLEALCYVVLLIMPVLGTMSDQEESVRHMASKCFASLVTLMPLETSIASPPEMPSALAEQRIKERCFLEQLLDTSKLESYSVAVKIKADLRKYQQDGINWLAFLNKYKLHGILCDDMGLGKTIQSLCIITSDHHYRKKEYEATGRADMIPLPSLVICPPTLTGHWYYEVKKFCDPHDITPLQYSGAPSIRSRLQEMVSAQSLIIASYDIVRNDIDFFSSVIWNYCILDEGHIIKNTRTKITKAVKQLRANHRLILSGTPIQNNVIELWSLFDFLMPGFLGTEKQFHEQYGKPILLSRDAKSSSKEQEAGALAMEALHRQVLPFLLRRMKEDVLKDLPPKIIQDYYCDLSHLQTQLYEDFTKSQAKQELAVTLEGDGEEEASRESTHVFQALQYLRKVCNHPALVLTPRHPMYDRVMEQLAKTSSSLRDIKHATKLLALKQLLVDCGIGTEEEEEEEEGVELVVSQHRVLLFCQYKSMLDIIESDLLKAHMPSVTYLRLDGSVAPGNRFDIVNTFNNDPSIDLLLLTTHVGGLGLNLTGADTVIFFEHDWNPMKDLQAMDRAHRIGQKKVVNVYRLITKGTLEEKIMSLQKFKLNIANTVITQENSSLLSMNTADLLDLFQLSEMTESKTESTSAGKDGRNSMRHILESMPELWDESQYTNEYDLSNFMKSLAKKES